MPVTAFKRRLSPLLAAAVGLAPLAASGPAAAAPQQTPTAQEPPVFGVQATAILVDVVVRDKKGHLVRDLTAADFELYEDGVGQAISSFRVVDADTTRDEDGVAPGQGPPAPDTAASAPDPSAPAAPSAPAPPESETASNPGRAVLAFVFDRLSPKARRLAHDAAVAYTERGHVAGDLVGVFAIDLALRTLQPFTSDLPTIRGSLALASAQANTAFASDREEARRRADAVGRADDALGALQGTAGAGGAAPVQAGLVAVQQIGDQIQVHMLRAFDSLERDQQGFATTNALLAVVNGLKAIPGRKTIVFFSEGVAIPANVLEQFRSVIAAANRANVAVYAIDAGGLRTESGLREAREELVQGSQQRLRQEEMGGRAFNPRVALSRQLERNEDALRLNPESGLGQLASETGGFLVRDTNDTASAFRRIAEDMRFHYLLSYSPSNERLDGRFRTITVKVARPELRVQSRKGYLAVRQEYALPVREYEAPALALLERPPRPEAFPIGVAALSFPEPDRPGLAPILVSLPGPAIQWEPAGDSAHRAVFAVVARIKDAQGREVDRLSEDYRLSAPADKLDAARRGDILFYREANLAPGRYTVEVVAYDAVAAAASVQEAALEIPADDDGRPRLSSLVVVNRAERLTAEEQKQRHPLHYGETILYPCLGVPFRKSTMPAVGFFFSLYGKSADAPTATIEVLQGSRTVAKTSSALGAPDASGRIQHAGALPLTSFAPGSYVLKVAVGGGAGADTRVAPFTVVE